MSLFNNLLTYIAGLLSEMGLSYLAAKLGINWFFTGLQLGLEVAEIERIQMDNPSDSYRQIFTILKRWRDKSSKPFDEKVKELIEALRKSELNNIVYDLVKKYNLDESLLQVN